MAIEFYPDCDNPDCKHAKIVWREGRRFVEYDDNYVPFDQFVRLALQTVLDDLTEIKHRLDDRSGLAP